MNYGTSTILDHEYLKLIDIATTMSRLGVEHHMFVQTLAARRIVSVREAEILIAKCIEIYIYITVNPENLQTPNSQQS